jgi:NAD(P)-dependent dehydrogenase (short-subunit alcohol dehydrogenase family)
MGLLTGRVAVVTGASSGIGNAIARALAEEGGKVVLVGRRKDRLEELSKTIADKGGEAMARATDVTNEADVIALFKDAVDRFGTVDILVNSAGIADDTPIDELTLARWREVQDANLTSAFLCCREAFKIMKAQDRGRIINIGSTSARVPRHNSPSYSSTKWGIEGLTRSLAIDGRHFGIAASILHPGYTVSELSPHAATATPGRDCMAAEDIGRIALLMASLPDGTNLYEGLALPLNMPFLGRG